MSVILEHAAILMASGGYIKNATDAFGTDGGVALRLLLDSVRQVLAARPPELLLAPLTIISPVATHDADVIVGAYGTVVKLNDAGSVAYHIAQNATSELLVVIAPDRTFRVSTPVAPFDHMVAATSAVVYHRSNDLEWIAAGSSNSPVLKLSSISTSAFADPTISSLEEALDHYGKLARETACELLKPIWEGGADGPRLVLSNKPEHFMRESLFQALSMILRNADVTREHMVDADKPVDIRVSFTSSPVEALIEIKWLGRAMAATGSQSSFTNYNRRRAQEGANQLANYLDLKKSSSAKQSVMGYLVIYDARRCKVQGPSDKLPKKDALAFEHDVLAFDPDHAKLRIDFKEPTRWFMRPRESNFLEAA